MQTLNLNETATNVENAKVETPIVKKETPAKKEKKEKPAKKETALTKLNLSMFKKKLENVEVAEKKTRETIYVYPEHLNTEEKRNGKSGKQWRNKQRSIIERFCNNILVFAKYNREVDLLNEIKAFKTNYKQTYRINDFSVNSVSQSASKEGNAKQIKLYNELSAMFEIIAEVEKQTSKKK